VPVCGPLCPKYGGSAPDHLLVVLGPRGFLDAALGFVLLAGDALDVDTQRYVHAVARPVGDLRGGHAGVQPRRYGRVSQVVGAPGKQGRRFLAAEGCGASLVEDLEVGPVVEDVAAGPVKMRPSGPGRYFLRCSLRSATKSGWMGTGRVSPRGRPVPVSAGRRPRECC
jgi:hypothetical protein